MIFNINFEDFRRMAEVEQGIVCFYESEEQLELFILKSGMPVIFKCTYFKQGEEADLIWKEQNMSNKSFLRITKIEKEISDLRLNIDNDITKR